MEAAAIDDDIRHLAGRPVTHVVLTHKHFDHVLGSSQFAEAEILCAPEVVEYLSTETRSLRAHAVGYGADAAEVDRAIAALKPPRHGIRDGVVDLGGRSVEIAHPGAGHTTADLVVRAPAPDGGGPVVTFTGDLVEESADPYIDADSDLPAWPATLDRLLEVADPTQSTYRVTAASSTPSSSVASEIGCGNVQATKPSERQLVAVQAAMSASGSVTLIHNSFSVADLFHILACTAGSTVSLTRPL